MNDTTDKTMFTEIVELKKKLQKSQKLFNRIHKILWSIYIVPVVIVIIGIIIPFLAPITMFFLPFALIFAGADFIIMNYIYKDPEDVLRNKFIDTYLPNQLNSDDTEYTFDHLKKVDKSLLQESGLFPESKEFTFRKNSEVFGSFQINGTFGMLPFKAHRIELCKYTFSKGKFLKSFTKELATGVIEAAVSNDDGISDSDSSSSPSYDSHKKSSLFSGSLIVVDLPQPPLESYLFYEKRVDQMDLFKNVFLRQPGGFQLFEHPDLIIAATRGDLNNNQLVSNLLFHFQQVDESTRYTTAISIRNKKLYILFDDNRDCIYKNICYKNIQQDDFEILKTQLDDARTITSICS